MSNVECDALIDFANAIEAAAVKLKHSLGVDCTKSNRSWSWNPKKIEWIRDVGKKGYYERTDAAENSDYKALIKDLQEHNGKLNRDKRFYWTFQNGTTVGRTIPNGA